MKLFQKCTAALLVLLTLCSFMNCFAVGDTQAEQTPAALSEEAAPAAQTEAAPQATATLPQAPVITKIEGSNEPFDTSLPVVGEEPEQPAEEPAAPQEPQAPETPAAPATVKIVTDTTELKPLSRLKLDAQVSGFDGDVKLSWESSKKIVATVNGSGEVFGLTVGKTTVTVKAEAGGKSATDSIDIFVTQPFGQIHNFLRDHEVLGYQYSYPDDYYYTNDKKCWQKYFGFSKFYDLVSPYILLEYDYVRVYFTYEGKDWMIQFWKGQYGLIFYGCEVGVYNRRHSSKEPGVFTLYNCAKEEDWMYMEQSLYHDTTGLGTYKREFTRPWDKYWWCTGFKRGHLRVEEPARELRSVGTIEMKDEEMVRLFTEGLEKCGFTRVEYGADLGLDSFSVDGRNVHFVWQNISHAETTMPVKALAVANVLAPIAGPFAMAAMFFLDIGLLLLL
ncbi:MAG: DUF4474 domain-containing protein [Clostridia bacterium]|nr:DUF4474 domain-containing protein [Clostridia bacterium]